MTKQGSTMKLTTVSILAGFAFLMQYLNFPLPMFPPFLKVDFSELPALVAGLMFGPLAGVLVEFLKNLLHYLFSGSDTGIPIGQLANFVAGSIFVVTTVLITRKLQGIKGLVTGLTVATILMAVIMSIANYWVILPAYAFLIHWEVVGPAKTSLVLYGIGPFNLVKGVLTALLFIPLYQRLKGRIHLPKIS
ncbi:ECF transporter S component [Marininema halotolerans]|uniref:Riboflavin transporter n=1 Tax=Marininema halotolerans TaxID=1155944 RepID=A0A1I6U8E2_9BACL|nr:ECF transporter S component [Marininema halotolerans]SFS97618.1 Riboflavin transporter FmnP [Marininema halotolerans]